MRVAGTEARRIAEGWSARARRRGSRVLPVAALLLVLGAGPAARAERGEGSGGPLDVVEGIFDVAILRPLGLTGVAAGSVFFAASAPFVAPAGNLSTAWDVFLYGPLEYTFRRPVGEF